MPQTKTKTVKTRPWREIRATKRTPAQLAALDAEVERDLIEMDLKEIRELTGHSQVEVAAKLETTQPEVSRLERRDDLRLSTLRRYVTVLGGKLEVTARFGDKRVRLRALG